MKQDITVEVGEDDLIFKISDDDFNKYINEQMPDDKVNAGFNFLSRTIDEASKEKFEKIALNGATPKGIVVMQIVGAVSSEFGSGVSITLKKSNALPKG